MCYYHQTLYHPEGQGAILICLPCHLLDITHLGHLYTLHLEGTEARAILVRLRLFMIRSQALALIHTAKPRQGLKSFQKIVAIVTRTDTILMRIMVVRIEGHRTSLTKAHVVAAVKEVTQSGGEGKVTVVKLARRPALMMIEATIFLQAQDLRGLSLNLDQAIVIHHLCHRLKSLRAKFLYLIGRATYAKTGDPALIHFHQRPCIQKLPALPVNR